MATEIISVHEVDLGGIQENTEERIEANLGVVRDFLAEHGAEVPVETIGERFWCYGGGGVLVLAVDIDKNGERADALRGCMTGDVVWRRGRKVFDNCVMVALMEDGQERLDLAETGLMAAQFKGATGVSRRGSEESSEVRFMTEQLGMELVTTENEAVKSYISPKVEVRDSETEGVGSFARERIAAGETVFVKGGHIVPREEVYARSVINSYHPISERLFVAAIEPDEEDGIKLFVNHACEPNVGIAGEITFKAMRDIEEGEELRFDYGTLDDEDYEFECRCGCEGCRGTVTGRDWRKPELQERYRGWFAGYLEEKIREHRAIEPTDV